MNIDTIMIASNGKTMLVAFLIFNAWQFGYFDMTTINGKYTNKNGQILVDNCFCLYILACKVFILKHTIWKASKIKFHKNNFYLTISY